MFCNKLKLQRYYWVCLRTDSLLSDPSWEYKSISVNIWSNVLKYWTAHVRSTAVSSLIESSFPFLSFQLFLFFFSFLFFSFASIGYSFHFTRGERVRGIAIFLFLLLVTLRDSLHYQFSSYTYFAFGPSNPKFVTRVCFYYWQEQKLWTVKKFMTSVCY